MSWLNRNPCTPLYIPIIPLSNPHKEPVWANGPSPMEPSSGSVRSAPEIFASEFFSSKAGLAKSVPGAEKVMGGFRSEGLGIWV